MTDMKIAINFETRRVWMRGDYRECYTWVSDRFDMPDLLTYEIPFRTSIHDHSKPAAMHGWSVDYES